MADSKILMELQIVEKGGKISIADGWRSTEGVDKGDRWQAAEIGSAVDESPGVTDVTPASLPVKSP